MPVKAQRCRVVSKLAVGRFEDDLGQMLHRFARVHLAITGDDRGDVDALGVSLEHAVGEEQNSVARLERQRLYAVFAAVDDPERRVGRELQVLDATVTES